MRGTDTSEPEIVEIRNDSLQLRLDGRELSLSFADFPWFRGAAAGDVLRVERPHPGHLRWPALDLDLAVDSLIHPERYPLVSRL